MTLADLQKDNRDMIRAVDIAEILGADPQDIRIQARHGQDKLGFPVVVIGTRVKIPRVPFLRFMGAPEQPG